MTTDLKIRLGLLAATLALSAFAAFATAHGFYVGLLDGTGPGPH